jgi:hypothetical protein
VLAFDNAGNFKETAEFSAEPGGASVATGLSMAFGHGSAGAGVDIAFNSTAPVLKFFVGP